MPHSGPRRLADYRKRTRLKQYELADLLGMHETTLSQVLSGKRRPGLDTALRIEARTGIPVNAWSDNALGKSRERGKASAKKGAVGRVQSDAAYQLETEDA